ncbi:MAG: hypothetical protein R3B96_09125 [Pirellulaceae bacterium]
MRELRDIKTPVLAINAERVVEDLDAPIENRVIRREGDAEVGVVPAENRPDQQFTDA